MPRSDIGGLARRIAIASGILVCGYLVIWIVVYSAIMDFDYRYVFEYLALGWRGGGELPATIQLLSLLITGAGGIVAFTIFVIARKAAPDNPKADS